MLQFVLDARADYIQCLEGDGTISKLADDWELTLSDVTEADAVIGMFSRQLGIAYDWTEERGTARFFLPPRIPNSPLPCALPRL